MKKITREIYGTELVNEIRLEPIKSKNGDLITLEFDNELGEILHAECIQNAHQC